MSNSEFSIKIIQKNKVEIFILEKTDFNSNDILLFPKEQETFQKLSNIARKNEFLGVRHIRNKFFPDLEIQYLNTGKPFVNSDNKFISISHSKNYLGFAIAPFPIGFDMEECNERIFKIKERFLNRDEQSLINSESISQLTSAWCIKESLFKLNNRIGIDFKNELIIKRFDESIALAEMLEINSWQSVNLFIEKIEDLILCINFE